MAARQMGFVLNAVGPASLRWRGLVRVLNGALSQYFFGPEFAPGCAEKVVGGVCRGAGPDAGATVGVCGVYGDVGIALLLSTTITLPLVSTILAGECRRAIAVCRLRHAKTAMMMANTI